MRVSVSLLVLLAFTFLTSSLVSAQSQTFGRGIGHPTIEQKRPYTAHSTDNEFAVAKAETEKPVEKSSVAPPESALTQQLRHDADELAYLAQSIPPDVDKTAKGLLPKDLALKLKRIEELSKQLRTHVTQ
jgi:hypothetical protein